MKTKDIKPGTIYAIASSKYNRDNFCARPAIVTATGQDRDYRSNGLPRTATDGIAITYQDGPAYSTIVPPAAVWMEWTDYVKARDEHQKRKAAEREAENRDLENLRTALNDLNTTLLAIDAKTVTCNTHGEIQRYTVADLTDALSKMQEQAS